MKLKFFWIPAVGSGSAEEELNQFLVMHRVVQVEKQFCATGNHGPGWSVCVEWMPAGEPGMPVNSLTKVGKVDYREVLDEATFRIYAILRVWRKETAAAAGVPIYAVATNEHLAAVAQGRIQTQAELEKVAGFGAARLAKHAAGLLEVCRREMGAKEAAP